MMPAESQWDSTRWRDAGQPPRSYDSLQQHPQVSATQTGGSALKESLAQPWYGTSHDQAPQYAYDSRRPSQTYGAPLSQYPQLERHTQGASYGPPNSTLSSNGDSHFASWRGDPPRVESTHDKRSGDASLSLHIPNNSSELATVAHGYTTPRSDLPMYSSGTSSWSHQTTSLPSFAALSEQASRTEEPDEVEIAPMSARIPCTQCTKLGPLIREVATAVAELDGSVQSLCSRVGSRSPDVPNESAMRTVQWILERMRYTKRDVQDVVQNRPQPSQPLHYSNPLKRSGDQWEQDDMPTLKLPRPTPSQTDGGSGDRRGSVDFATREPIQRSAYSPAPSDSAPGSAYPRHGSPTSGRLPRALPSPSSLAFPPSGPASFVPANTASVGSPGTSYHPASSIHTVSTNSATSAHMQDLQHQVSLKSLALQTLQTEYATLLQKLQRERIKSQTIEKKTTVADQEVNDLTTRNEELSEQIRALEAQLQDCERKRESEREDAAKEKQQWGRMLDMSGRLQSKHATDQQRLAKEKADLLQRLSAYETNGSAQGDRSTSIAGQSDPLPTSQRSSPSTVGVEAGTTVTYLPGNATSGDIDALRRENDALQATVAALRASLEEFRRQYGGLEETIEQLIAQKDQMKRTMDAPNTDRAFDKFSRAANSAHDNFSTSKATYSNREYATPRVTKSPSRPEYVLPPVTKDQHSDAGNMDPLSPENLAQIARAVSPGPAELGIHVQPSTSSPEELIKALGPVPAPLPSIRFYSSSFEDSTSSSDGQSKQKRRQSQPFVAPLSLPHDSDAGLAQVPSFRPLNHQGPYHTQRSQYYEASPHSYHSSPGPNMSNTSSPGSTSTHSPEYTTTGRGEDGFARRHSQPYMHFVTSPSTAAMPPPPRPLP